MLLFIIYVKKFIIEIKFLISFYAGFSTTEGEKDYGFRFFEKYALLLPWESIKTSGSSNFLYVNLVSWSKYLTKTHPHTSKEGVRKDIFLILSF